jgi:hypothetical protein
MKIFFLIFLFIVLFGCSNLELETDTRIAVKGKIIDENNQPISNIPILVYAYKDGYNGGLGCVGCDIRKIMSGKTNFNGDFILFSPKVKNLSKYIILINTYEENDPWNGIDVVNTNYKNFRIKNITDDYFSDYTYNTGTKTLLFNP